MLFRIIAERNERCSTIFTTNYDFTEWGKFVSDEMVVRAMADRLLHRSVILNMNGPNSYRREEARARMRKLYADDLEADDLESNGATVVSKD
jgi:DNA replication protein DnaC